MGLMGCDQLGQCILFYVVFTFPPLSHHSNVWLLPVISQLTLYRRCGLAYPYDWRGFVGPKKKTSMGLPVFNSSMSMMLHNWSQKNFRLHCRDCLWANDLFDSSGFSSLIFPYWVRYIYRSILFRFQVSLRANFCGQTLTIGRWFLVCIYRYTYR